MTRLSRVPYPDDVRSVKRRVSERAGEFDSEAAVGTSREPRGVRQLAEPCSIGSHREDLIVAVAIDGRVSPPRAEMERVLCRVEDDGLRDRILIDDPIASVSDSAAAQKAAR